MKKQLLKVLISQILIMMTFFSVSHAKDLNDPLLKIAVEGKVTDDTGAPLPGVNIIEKGTANGAVSANASGASEILIVDWLPTTTSLVAKPIKENTNTELASDASNL